MDARKDVVFCGKKFGHFVNLATIGWKFKILLFSMGSIKKTHKNRIIHEKFVEKKKIMEIAKQELLMQGDKSVSKTIKEIEAENKEIYAKEEELGPTPGLLEVLAYSI